MKNLHYTLRLPFAFTFLIVLSSFKLQPATSNKYFVTNQTELASAIGKSVPGDIITMKNGVWNNIDIVFKGVGSENRPITLKAETAGQVIISGSSSLRLSGEYLIVDGLNFKNGHSSRNFHLIEFKDGKIPANHCRITNISVSRFNKEDGTDTWVGFYGKHNRVDHSLFEGKVSKSVLMIVWRSTPEADYHRIDHNHFKDIPSIGNGGAIAIRIGDGTQALSSSVTTVESNIFENMLGIGKIINIKSSGNIIRGNTFIKASGSICLRHGDNNLIEGNYILPGLRDNYTGGILVIGENHIIRHNYIQGTRRKGKPAIVLYEGDANNYQGKGSYYPTKNILIENNTLVDNDKNILIGQIGQVYDKPGTEMTVPVENITYKKNVIVGNNTVTPLIEILDKPKGKIIYEGNLFFNGNSNGLENIPGISIKDPLLTLGADSIYHYNANSPLKSNILAPPLKRNEVGPTWMRISN
ncbi:polysaccharide lyase 6 family protein [Pseudopedobacter sp.]|uniref:polysaccharide lyase 6 family protein n=1 Tax=Pseudopedobacter sp. TaxID=1936787 RepID=UPI00333E3DA1